MRGRPRGRAAPLLILLLASCAAPERPTVQPAEPPARPALHAPIPAEPLTLTGSPCQGALLQGTIWPGAERLMLDGKPVPFDAEGNFIIAFDRDAGPRALLVALLPGGRAVERRLAVAPGDWPLEQVNASPTGSAATSAEFRARRAGELAQIEAARAKAPPGDGWRQRFIWPVAARISGRFGAQRVYRGQPGAYHGGVDLAGGAGTVYVAPADGVVTLAATAPFTLEGNLLIVDHGMGLSSAFLHSQRLLVKEGDHVRQGQPLGLIGATGRATGPHLHWGMKWGAARIDPVGLVESGAD